MKKKIVMSICIIFSYFTSRIHAQDVINTNTLYLPQCNYQDVHRLLSEPEFGVMEKHSEKHKISGTGIISGAIIAVGGAIISAGGYYMGTKYYDRYKKSAFTENTDRLRNKVTGCTALSIGGAVIGGIGVVVFTLSF